MHDLPVFSPRVRGRYPTRRGVVWRTEPLFPNYFFAQFSPTESLDTVRYTPGVKHVVRFGWDIPVVPNEIIEQLRADFQDDQPKLVEDSLIAGQRVSIATGVFMGLEGTVLRLMPARERVQVLIEFLGRWTTVELDRHYIVAD